MAHADTLFLSLLSDSAFHSAAARGEGLRRGTGARGRLRLPPTPPFTVHAVSSAFSLRTRPPGKKGPLCLRSPIPVIKTESPSTPFPKHRLVADSTEDVDVNGRGTQPRGCPQGRPLETNRKGQKCHTPASCWGRGRPKPGERGARGPAHGGGFVLSAALSLVAAGAAACPRSPARPLPAVLPRHARRERVSKHLVSFAARPTPRSRRRQLPPQG